MTFSHGRVVSYYDHDVHLALIEFSWKNHPDLLGFRKFAFSPAIVYPVLVVRDPVPNIVKLPPSRL